MKNILLITFCLLCISISSFAQVDKAVVINFNAHQNAFLSFNNAFKHQVGFPSLEYQRRKGKRVLSYELAKLTWKKSPTYEFHRTQRTHVYSDRNFQAMGRIQWQRLLRSSTKKLQPYLGAALSPFYARTYRVPLKSSYFPKSIASAGVSHHFSLGSYYNLGNYFINANALVGISSIEVVKQNKINPSLTQQKQVSSILDFDLFDQDHLFRIGIGMIL